MYTSDEAMSPDLRKAKSPYMQPMEVGEGLSGYPYYSPNANINNLEYSPEDMIPRRDPQNRQTRLMGLQPISESGSPGKTTNKDSNIVGSVFGHTE